MSSWTAAFRSRARSNCSQALLHLSGTPQGAATLSRLNLNGFALPRLPAPRIMSAAVRVAALLAVLAAGRLRGAASGHAAGHAAAVTVLTPLQLLAAVQSDADRIDQAQDPRATRAAARGRDR